ncbi:hypothetical protein CUMW_204380, partial [Citrus unshiu]
MDKANGITDRFEERAVSIGHYADLDGISDQLPSSSGGRQVDIHFDWGVDGLRPSRSDESHPYYHRINEALKDLLERMEQEGYVPDTKEELLDVEEEQKKNILYDHGERLALVFGIIGTPDGTTIR